ENQLQEKDYQLGILNKNLNDSLLQNQNLNNNINNLQQQKQNLEKELENLQKANKQKDQDNNQLKQKLNENNIQNDQKLNELQCDLENIKKKNRKDIQKFNDEIKQKEDDIQKLLENINGLDFEKQQSNNQIKNLEDSINQLNNQIQELKKDINSKDDMINQLKQNANDNNLNNDKKINDLENQYKKKQYQQQNEFDQLTQQLQDKDDEINQIKISLNQLKAEKEKSENNLNQLSALKQSLEKQFEELQQKNNEKDDQFNGMKQNLNDQSIQYESRINDDELKHQKQHKEQDKQILKLNQMLQEKDEINGQMKKKLNDTIMLKEQRIKDLQNIFDEKDQQFQNQSKQYLQELQQKDDSINQFRRKLSEVNRQKEQLSNQLEIVNDQIQQQENNLQELTQSLVEKQQQLNYIKANLNDANRLNDQYENDLKSLSEENNRLNNLCDQLAKDITVKDKELNKSKRILNDSIQEKENQLKELQFQQENNNILYEGETQKLKQIISQKDNELNQLKRILNDVTHQKDNELKEIQNQLQKEKRNLENLIQELKNGDQEKEIQLDQLKNSLKDINSQNETKTKQLNDKYEQLQKQDGQLSISENIKSKKQTISSLELVPGDIMEIPDGQIMPCDLIMLNGSAVINESMLTGESIPIIKQSLPYNNNKYNPDSEGKQSTIFAGTKCIETRYYLKGKLPVLGLVMQTSFNTMKGQLVRSILYPKQNSFQFYVDSLKFIAVLAILAVLGFLVSLYYQIEGYKQDYIALKDIILNSFDLITITVPPALPTCLQIGISCALHRLKKKKIFCISPPKVNISGKVTIMCFDKTGTLTEEGLDMYGVRSVQWNQKTKKVHFTDLKSSCDKLAEIKKKDQNEKYPIGDPEMILKECMSSCHGLTRVQGNIIGDPLEVKMFEFTGWELIESQEGMKFDDLILAQVQSKNNKLDSNNESVGILKRFEFSSKLQRMSTIVKSLQNPLQNQYRLYVKGSPEKIYELCKKDTIPDSFHNVLDFYATKGFRVLGFGVRTLKLNYRQIQKVERDEIEKDLTFVGLIIMENKLKEITSQIINELQQANIRTIMVTGDNPLTAISVGRQCNIIHEKARVYFGDLQDETDQIIWKDFDHSEKILNKENLEPVGGIEPYQEEEGVEEIKQEKELLECIKQIDNNKKLSEYNKKISINQVRERYKVNDQDRSKSFDIMRNISKRESLYHQMVESKENIEIYSQSDAEDINIPWVNLENFTLAITGRAFSKMYNQSISDNKKQQQLFREMLNRTQIFARMKPEEKAQLLQSLQNLPHKPTCGMCGDGANDCGALKTADIGVSLSDAEASIAAPFTSKIQDISCIIQVLIEGRAALVTSFSCFKFMALYSMIQFVCTTLLFTVGSLPADLQFLYWDVFIILPLAFLMGLTEAYPVLSKQVPGSSLVSFQVLFSVIGQSVIFAIFQTIILFIIQAQSWYLPMIDIHGVNYQNDMKDDNKEDIRKICYESSILFYTNNFQYIISCLAFSIGKPFKKPFYTNKYFTGSLIAILIISLYIQVIPDQQTIDYLDVKQINFLFILYFFLQKKKIFTEVKYQNGQIAKKMPQYWTIIFLVFSLANYVISVFFEKHLVPLFTYKYKNRKNNRNNQNQNSQIN
ncbi:hypothetical protein IMG5_196550, partial [Ichthyophthirius multifiliis]